MDAHRYRATPFRGAQENPIIPPSRARDIRSIDFSTHVELLRYSICNLESRGCLDEGGVGADAFS